MRLNPSNATYAARQSAYRHAIKRNACHTVCGRIALGIVALAMFAGMVLAIPVAPAIGAALGPLLAFVAVILWAGMAMCVSCAALLWHAPMPRNY